MRRLGLLVAALVTAVMVWGLAGCTAIDGVASDLEPAGKAYVDAQIDAVRAEERTADAERTRVLQDALAQGVSREEAERLAGAAVDEYRRAQSGEIERIREDSPDWAALIGGILASVLGSAGVIRLLRGSPLPSGSGRQVVAAKTAVQAVKADDAQRTTAVVATVPKPA